MNVKKIMSLAVATILTFTMSISSFATTPTTEVPEPKHNIISQTEEWVSPSQKITTTKFDLGDGYTSTLTETSTYGNPYTRASGTVNKTAHKSLEYQSRSLGYVHVEALFSYNGDTAHVIDSDYTYAFIESDYVMSKWATSEGDSGLLSKAYASVDYRVTKQSTGNWVLNDTCKVTCSKDGN